MSRESDQKETEDTWGFRKSVGGAEADGASYNDRSECRSGADKEEEFIVVDLLWLALKF